MDHEFYTLKGYDIHKHQDFTPSDEDYLEMICRHCKEAECDSVNHLAKTLNVRPSSSSKMVTKLKKLELVDFEPYGKIKPTKKGLEYGNYLLHRHDVLNQFFCMINNSEDELELIEKIEHFIDRTTIGNIEKWLVDEAFKHSEDVLE